MKQIISKLLTIVVLICISSSTAIAQDPLEYLNKTFPQLTNLYREELSKYPAHYIFAIDVSGSMNQYSDMVTSSLIPFFQALPDRDRVDVIPFGTDALKNMLSYCGTISPDVRTALCQNIKNLYTDESYQQGFKGYTDIKKAVEAIADVIQNNREYKVNVVIILTDFRNDVKGDTPSEHKLKEEVMQELNQKIGAATNDVYSRFVALELPVDRSKPGYCLNQLKESVFPTEGSGLEIVSLNNPGEMIGQWFEQLKRDIMITKLKAVIDNANRTNPVKLNVKTNIDGKVSAEIHWTPNKLYPRMRIDSTFMDGSEYKFINNKDVFTETMDSVIDIELLGQIKHQNYGLRHMNDSINLGIQLPTPYDNELTSLGVRKPLPSTKQEAKGWLFTFFMPFWLTLAIIIAIILYIIGVMKSMARNRKLCFKGNVTFYDAQGNQLDNMIRLPKQAPSTVLKFGQGGSPRLSLQDADWQFVIEKKKANPFLVFTKPYFLWRGTKKFVASGKKQSGKLEYNGSNSVRVKCGNSRNEITHGVKVMLVK